jgi:glutathione S-transferase
MPNGRLPVLEANGQKLSGKFYLINHFYFKYALPCSYKLESTAILRFLAKKFGLAGKTDLDQLKSDEIVDLHKDFTNEIKPFFYTASGFREGDKSHLLDSVFLPAAGRYFTQLQEILERNSSQLSLCKKAPFGGPFLTGLVPTFADFLVWFGDAKYLFIF